MTKGLQSFNPDAAVQVIEYCFSQGWSDGLPLVPPTPTLVESFLAYTRRDRRDVIGRIENIDRECTVELAAINSAMAGCRPEYFPVVLAALEAVLDEGLPQKGAWQSTTGSGPLLIVNGPVRNELGFNSKGNIFGPGFRANATVGRAMRLIIMNVFGVKPHDLDQSTQGTPGKYSLCIAENEEDSPWPSLHVELGFPSEKSVVSAVSIRSCDFLDNRNTDDPLHILNDIVDTVSRTGAAMAAQSSVCVIMGPEHAQLLARRGYSKADVKEFIAEHCGRLYSDLRRVGKEGIQEGLGLRRPMGHENIEGQTDLRDTEKFVRFILSANDVIIVVSGAKNAGISTVAQLFGRTVDQNYYRGPGTSTIVG